VPKLNKKTELEKVSAETMRFMRGKYNLDEVPGKYYEIDCLKFKQGKQTVLSINIHEDHFDFQIIYGKAERERFEARIGEFPREIRDLYNNSRALPDGLWMLIRVDDLITLEAVKHMIMIKKKPNRKPFPKESAVYGECGHRCDLCVHYVGGTADESFRKKLHEHVCRVYGWNPDDAIPPCNGCSNGGYDGKSGCEQKKCAKTKGVSRCMDCDEYACGKATAGWPPKIEAKFFRADDVTWAILPYVDGQYGN